MSLSTVAAAAGAEPSPGAMRFGRVCAQPGGVHTIRWELAAHNSGNACQTRIAFALLAGVSLLVATVATALGAALALPLAGVELLLVATAFGLSARHARDREAIELGAGGRLTVERCSGQRVERLEFNGAWARVEPACDGCALIRICGQGRRVEVGRFVRPELRPELARELSRALRADPGGAGARDPENS